MRLGRKLLAIGGLMLLLLLPLALLGGLVGERQQRAAEVVEDIARASANPQRVTAPLLRLDIERTVQRMEREGDDASVPRVPVTRTLRETRLLAAESVTVEAYGSMVPLKQCAAISTPDARLIQIQPWDVSLVKSITKGIIDANLGFNPIPDGKTIRVPLPEMSRERRQEFVKNAHRLAEEGRVHVRNVRRDALEQGKKAKLPEDEQKRLEKDIQTATDKAIADINSHLAHKEKELLTV